MFRFQWTALCVAALLWSAAAEPVAACPFCSAVSMTLSEEIKSNDVAVIARLVSRPKSAASAAAGTIPLEANKCQFEVVEVLKGQTILGDNRKIDVLYFGDQPLGTSFLIFGVDPSNIGWSTPTALSDRAVKYVAELPKLPESGADRLAFFQEFFEDEDALLAADAYDEFAKAPYGDVKDLKERMHRVKLIAWIKDPKMTASRRRLYLTMLGVCGRPDDVGVLEEMIRTEDRQVRTALDAMIACYLNLKGPDGMPLIEDLFLKNSKAEYTDTYSAIMALRFHGQETDIIPRERLMQGLRHMLDRPQLADLVIPDLARWQDWSVMDRLVQLFKDADQDSAWVRVPVINYLRACPLPEAKERIEQLREVDPDAVKRASQFFPIGVPPGATRPTSGADTGGQQTDEKSSSAVPGGQQRSRAAGPTLVSSRPVASSTAAPPHDGPAGSSLGSEVLALATVAAVAGSSLLDSSGAAASTASVPTVDKPVAAAAEVAPRPLTVADAARGQSAATGAAPIPTAWVLLTAPAVAVALLGLFVMILRGDSQHEVV